MRCEETHMNQRNTLRIPPSSTGVRGTQPVSRSFEPEKQPAPWGLEPFVARPIHDWRFVYVGVGNPGFRNVIFVKGRRNTRTSQVWDPAHRQQEKNLKVGAPMRNLGPKTRVCHIRVCPAGA